jgi:hypothetical protein
MVGTKAAAGVVVVVVAVPGCCGSVGVRVGVSGREKPGRVGVVDLGWRRVGELARVLVALAAGVASGVVLRSGMWVKAVVGGGTWIGGGGGSRRLGVGAGSAVVAGAGVGTGAAAGGWGVACLLKLSAADVVVGNGPGTGLMTGTGAATDGCGVACLLP